MENLLVTVSVIVIFDLTYKINLWLQINHEEILQFFSLMSVVTKLRSLPRSRMQISIFP